MLFIQHNTFTMYTIFSQHNKLNKEYAVKYISCVYNSIS